MDSIRTQGFASIERPSSSSGSFQVAFSFTQIGQYHQQGFSSSSSRVAVSHRVNQPY
jgi:hypothetical protein